MHVYDHFLWLKWLAKLSIFLILVLVSEFVVMVNLSEWWSRPTTADHCEMCPGLEEWWLHKEV